ncbi:hypothetical protein [Flavobacterium phragmitis]|uniref:O-Antigen ligase n=1 Tax=Flavobacterium phragmitis TaxID=739143 RepID=A0A1I1NTE5_9FLAO|nr:hypothetical protein [Flavobacterium phragmitis]SFD00582.1 hypothetical protein SAMN05216297_103432 [Flavobacterium phragmitis]
MIAKYNVLPAFFIVKIILDFFSPFRELNIVLQLCFILPILLDRHFLNFIVKRKLNFVLLYFFFYVVISKNIQSVKIFIAVLLYCIFLFIGYKSIFNTIIKRSKLIWRVGLICFSVSLLISLFKGSYARREFYNFEHVNLLGTYFVFISLFYLIYYQDRKKNAYSIKFSSLNLAVGSYLTLSTGAFVTQITAFIPLKYYKLKNVLLLLIILIIAFVSFYYITNSVSPDLHQKIFGSINYFRKEISLKEFYQESIHQSLVLNESENSGSFTWRIFSYTFYLYKIFNQDFVNIVFGSGVESFLQYADFAPHNDFIAILLDFGLLGLFCFLSFLYKFFKMGIQSSSRVAIAFIVFVVLRLLFENVIYSSYVFSLITSLGGLLYGSLLRNTNTNRHENTLCV